MGNYSTDIIVIAIVVIIGIIFHYFITVISKDAPVTKSIVILYTIITIISIVFHVFWSWTTLGPTTHDRV